MSCKITANLSLCSAWLSLLSILILRKRMIAMLSMWFVIAECWLTCCITVLSDRSSLCAHLPCDLLCKCIRRWHLPATLCHLPRVYLCRDACIVIQFSAVHDTIAIECWLVRPVRSAECGHLIRHAFAGLGPRHVSGFNSFIVSNRDYTFLLFNAWIQSNVHTFKSLSIE